MLARCWFRRNQILSISARCSIVLMIVAGAPRLGALPEARGVLLGLAVAAAAGLIIATSVKLAVPAVHHVAVLGHWRPLGRAGDAPSDLRDSPAGAPIVGSANFVRHRAGGAGPNTTFCRPAGTFYRGGAGRRRRNCTRCADRVASSSTRCCRLLNAFARHAECITVHAGLVPVTIGLIAASALIIVRDADHEWTGLAISAATGALVYATRLSPLAAFARRGTPGVRGFRVTITMNAFGAGRPCARHGLEHKLIQLPGREGLDVGDAAAGRDNQSIEPN